MKKYIIWTPALKLNSGGVTLLHRLAHMINELGYKAYVWPGDNNFEVFLTNSKYNLSMASEEMINDDAIIVYPEITIGNPLNAKHVVRWILNKPGILGGDGIYGENDMIFFLSDAFTDGKQKVNYLKIMELYGKMFVDRDLDRKGSCYVMRKGKGKKIIHDLSDSIEITDSTPSEELVRIFNERKYFYCYDYASFLSLQAALCGCISIAVPYDGVTAEEWLGYNKTRKYGIAYGEENIEHSINTMDNVRPHLESLEREFYRNVENFIHLTQTTTSSNNEINLQQNKISFLTIEKMQIISEELIETNEFFKAEGFIKDILEKDPSNIRALNNLSIIKILDNKYSEAKLLVDQILKLDEENDLAIDNYEYLNELQVQQIITEETI